MTSSLLGIGTSGLNAAQLGLATTSHNISNVNTPGYSRQQTIQSTNIALGTGAGFIGRGVHVETIERVYSQFLTNQVLRAETGQAELSGYYQSIRTLDNLLADPSTGVAPVLEDFFSGLHDLSANPASTPARQTLLSSAESLAARFNAIDAQMREMRTGVNSQITATVGVINSLATQIASVNQEIVIAQSAAAGRPPNDLLDQRDALVAELNREIRVTVVRQDDGAYNVFIGNGQALVLGNVPSALQVTPDGEDPTKLGIAYVANGAVIPLKEDLLQGGNLGGQLAFRRESLDPAQNALGRIAIALAQSVNDQHRLGQNLLGTLGGDFFSIGVPTVTPRAGNAGSGAVAATIADVTALTASDYRLDYDGAQYRLTRLSDGVVQAFAGLPQNVDGLTLGLSSGAPAAGDSFLIRPTVDGASAISVLIKNPALVAAAAPIRTAAALANSGSGTVSAGVVLGPPPPNANLQQPVSITFNSPPSTFNVSGAGTGNPVNVPYTPGAPIVYNGWQIEVSGAPAAGDVFRVESNVGGTADGRNALLLAGIQTTPILGNATMTLQSGYGALLSEVGNRTRQVEVLSNAQDKLVDQARQAQQAVSGVNLDEEAANLLRYQQAYQASAKLMQIASTLFDQLLALG